MSSSALPTTSITPSCAYTALCATSDAPEPATNLRRARIADAKRLRRHVLAAHPTEPLLVLRCETSEATLYTFRLDVNSYCRCRHYSFTLPHLANASDP